MKTITGVNDLYEHLSHNRVLFGALKDFAAQIVAEGLENIALEESNAHDMLVMNGICTIAGKNLKIAHCTAVAIALYEYFKKRDNSPTKSDYKHHINTLAAQYKKLKPPSYNPIYKEIKVHLYAVAMLRYRFKGNDSLEEFVKSVAREIKDGQSKRSVYMLADAFGSIIPELNISSAILFSLTTYLLNLTESEADYNTNQTKLLQGVRKLADENAQCAISLFHYSCKETDETQKIISVLTSGLYDKMGDEFIKDVALPYWKESKTSEAIMLGLGIVSEPGYQDGQIMLKLYDERKDAPDLISAATRMLLGLLRSKKVYPERDEIIIACFKRFTNSLQKHDAVYARSLLNQVAFIDDSIQEKTKLMLAVIAQPYFTVKEFMGVIGQMYWYIHDARSLKDVLSAVADKEPFKDLGKQFSSSLHNMNKIELDEIIIELVTDNKSSNRELGNSLFNRDRGHCTYVFDFDILSLSPIQQYKLWVGLCQNIGEPQNYLHALLPLLNSSSETVREGFISKLEELSEDYAGHIINILKEGIATHNRPDVIERVQTYCDDFYSKFTDIKLKIPELDPYVTQNRLIREYNKLHSRSFSRNVEKGSKKSSIMSLFGKTLKLGKGGGWKLPGRDEVSPLSHIQTGMALPRSLFIYPEQYDILAGMEQRIDREEEEFDIIKNLIANE